MATYDQTVKAYYAIQSLVQTKMPFGKARLVWQMQSMLKEDTEFYISEEKKLVKEFGIDASKYRPSDPKCAGFTAKLMELKNTEAHCHYAPIALLYSDVPMLRISAEEMMALDGFVNFMEKEGEE